MKLRFMRETFFESRISKEFSSKIFNACLMLKANRKVKRNKTIE